MHDLRVDVALFLAEIGEEEVFRNVEFIVAVGGIEASGSSAGNSATSTPISEFVSSIAPMACIRGLCLLMRLRSDKPVLPSSPVRV